MFLKLNTYMGHKRNSFLSICCIVVVIFFLFLKLHASDKIHQNDIKIQLFLVNAQIELNDWEIVQDILQEIAIRTTRTCNDNLYYADMFSEEETKTALNYYLGYCLNPWGAFLSVIDKKKISSKDIVLLMIAKLSEKKISEGLEIRLFRLPEDRNFPFEFPMIGGKKYIGVDPEEKQDIVDTIEKYLIRQTNIIKTNHNQLLDMDSSHRGQSD